LGRVSLDAECRILAAAGRGNLRRAKLVLAAKPLEVEERKMATRTIENYLRNNPGLHAECCSLAGDVLLGLQENSAPQIDDGIWTKREALKYLTGNTLKALWERRWESAEASIPEPWRSLAQSALSGVDWDEVADNFTELVED
jgi:hypothetical protein